MKTRPDWLPPLANIDGPIEIVVPQLYAIFHHDIVSGGLRLNNWCLIWDQHPREIFGLTYEECFWHLVSRYRYMWTSAGLMKQRDFDPLRAERLPWFAPTVKHANSDNVLVWNYLEKGRRLRTYVWLYDWDYVIVLEPKRLRKGMVYFIITAYYVDGPATKKSLEIKYEKRCR